MTFLESNHLISHPTTFYSTHRPYELFTRLPYKIGNINEGSWHRITLAQSVWWDFWFLGASGIQTQPHHPAVISIHLALRMNSPLLFYSRIDHDSTVHVYSNDDPVILNSLRQHDAWQSALPPQCRPSSILPHLPPLSDSRYMLQLLLRLQPPSYRVGHSYQAQRSKWAGIE